MTHYKYRASLYNGYELKQIIAIKISSYVQINLRERRDDILCEIYYQ